MTRRAQQARERRREKDLAVLRDAVDNLGGRVATTDRELRRLVKLGYAEHPQYANGQPRPAWADITAAGRAVAGR